MAVSEFAIVTLAEIKNFLGLTDTVSTRDAWLEREAERVSQRVETWLDRRVKARFYREDLDDDYRTNTLYLKNTPIVAVQNVYIDGDRTFGSDTRLEDTGYKVYGDRIEFAWGNNQYGYGYEFYYTRHATERLKTIRVEYVAGWGTLEIPFTRQRIDLREETGGDLLTFYLDAGVQSPTDIVDALNIELNTAGDNEREVSFDWRTRTFKITQADGELSLYPSESGSHAESDSALPLLGFTGTGHDSSPATGDSVTLEIPSDLKSACLDLIAHRYDTSEVGNKRRGLTRYELDDYRVTYAAGENAPDLFVGSEASATAIAETLSQYKNWTFI